MRAFPSIGNTQQARNGHDRHTSPSAWNAAFSKGQADPSTQQRGARFNSLGLATAIAIATLLGLASTAARAVDGCLVLMCLAAPKWQDIPMCVPTINAVMRDMARGKPFPVCGMGGNGNEASHAWSSVPDLCPPQYTRTVQLVDTTTYSCDYSGAISVFVDQQLFTRTWWSMGGDSVTEYTPAAKTQLGSWDPRWDNELATWQAAQQAAIDAAAAAAASPGGI